MSSLQTLIQTIVTDVINARFAADVRAVELASLYRDNPSLRGMPIPALNISNVSVELRVAFDETVVEAPAVMSDQQKAALNSGVAEFRNSVMKLDSVVRTAQPQPQRGSALAAILSDSVAKVAATTAGATPEIRRSAIEGTVSRLLKDSGVKLKKADKTTLADAVRRLDETVIAAPQPKQPTIPSVLIGAERLTKVTPQAITTIKFEIDLGGLRWADPPHGQGDQPSVLVQD